MSRAGSYFAQAISAPAVRAALIKVARCHSVAGLVQLLTAHNRAAAEPELHDWLAAFEQPRDQRNPRGSAGSDADLDDKPLRNLNALRTAGTPP